MKHTEARRALALALFVFLAGCEAGLTDACVDSPDLCPPCAADADCVIVGNSCHPTMACAHEDAHLSTTMEGCLFGYEAPPAEDCRCVASVCRTAK